MAGPDLMTIEEAADALHVRAQRVHQLLASGELEGVELAPGRRRYPPRVGRVTAASVADLLAERQAEQRRRAAAREGARSRRRAVAPMATSEVGIGSGSGTTALTHDAAAARAAAQELKVQLDALREEVRKERARSRQLLEVAANLVDLLKSSSTSADDLDDVAEGYSQALTQLLAPHAPPESRTARD